MGAHKGSSLPVPPRVCSFVQHKNGERSVGNKAALFLLPPTPGA